MRAVRARRDRDGTPCRQARQPWQTRTGPARVGRAHGTNAVGRPLSSALPATSTSTRAPSRTRHKSLESPGALKGARRVRRKAAEQLSNGEETVLSRRGPAQPILFTDATTVFVMDTSRQCRVAVASGHRPGADRAGGPAAGHLRTSTRPTSRWPASTGHAGAGADIRRHSAGRGRAPRALGDWCDAWTERIAVLYRAHRRAGGHHAGHRRPQGRRPPLAAGLRRHRRAPHPAGQRRQGPAAPGRRQGHRHAQQK